MKKKEKVSLFEAPTFENKNAAEELLEKENKKWNFKLICTAVAGVGSIFGWLIFNESLINNDVVAFIGAILWILGIIGAMLAGSFFNYFKIIWKFAKFGWYIVPFFLWDLLGFAFGAVIGLMVVLLLPVVPAALSLVQARRNKQEAEKFLVYTNAQNSVSNTQPEVNQ